MGMQVRLVLYAAEEPVARDMASSAFAEIARLDAILSNYRRDSEINALTEGPAPRPVTPELLEVLGRAQALAEFSDGAFDVTAGPLTELWRDAIARGELPASTAIAAARARSGYRRLTVNTESGTVAVAPGTMLDVGGLAKGFVLDRALAVIVERGIAAALVEAGGDLVVGAAPPHSDAWRVDLPHLGCAVDLAHAALATSGDEYQFVEVDGVRYAHIVDPRSGYGLTDARTVTVVADDGLTADGLATTLTIVSRQEGERLLVSYPSARLVSPSAAAEGETAVCSTESRPAHSR